MTVPAAERRLALVTGASGFLGAHVVRALCLAGWRVVAACRSDSDLRRLERLTPPDAKLRRAAFDLLDGASVEALFAGEVADAAIHCAAYGVAAGERNLQRALAVNVSGTARLVMAAARAGVGRLIHVGTGYEYGEHAGPIDEGAELRPTEAYGISKATASLLALDLARDLGLPLAVLRPFAMYGPFEDAGKLVPLALRAGLSGEPLDLSAGEQLRDYVHVGDVARLCAELAAAPDFPAGEAFNLGSGEARSLSDFIRDLVAAAGGDLAALRWGQRAYRAGEPMSLVSDPGKAMRQLGWRPVTALADGARETAAALERR